ncbi:Hint domain-containing protein [Roseovarius nanhaiticus]|uniref:Hint domain-containing protein n=1 Tax=Roseovarius nanhaiticus TaxID=573024 RepID=UPI002490BB10|nr:Hint domain-containing protein [Roseovarius nanhaiticus]
MVAKLQGVRFDQVYTDNSEGAEFDTDGDGTATQEDEFVSFTNDSGDPIDISGWQIWSQGRGANAPDSAREGHFHTFPSGTVLQPGQTLYVINEITGPPPAWAQEASQGGVESGAGGNSTNIMTEGNTGQPDSLALVDPSSGEYIVFNMDAGPPRVASQPGFPGTKNIGTVDGQSVQDDQAAGSSYQYDSGAGKYTYSKTFVPCFAAGTRIATPDGPRLVEHLRAGDLVLTRDHGARPLRMVLARTAIFDPRPSDGADADRDKPIELKPGTLGHGLPERMLILSPNHRILVTDAAGREVLVPAKALTGYPGIRRRRGARQVRYLHLVLARHEIILAEGAATESYLAGDHAMAAALPGLRHALATLPGPLPDKPARPIFGAAAARRMLAARAIGKVLAPPPKHATLAPGIKRQEDYVQWASSTF